jgi:hypothetical protein
MKATVEIFRILWALNRAEKRSAELWIMDIFLSFFGGAFSSCSTTWSKCRARAKQITINKLTRTNSFHRLSWLLANKAPLLGSVSAGNVPLKLWDICL